MASNIIRMVLKLDDKASPELKQVGQEAEKTTSRTTVLGKASKVSAGQIAMIGTAALGVVMSMKTMAQSYADSINQFGDAATITGASTETLETLAQMAGGTNVQFGELTRGLSDFNKGLGELRTTGKGTLKDAFEAVDFDPSGLESTDEVLVQFINTLQSYGDQQKVAFAANRAFGISGKKMVAALDVGKFQEYNDEMDHLGFVATPEAVEQAQKLQKGTALSEAMMERLKIQAFETFLGPEGMLKGMGMVLGVAAALAEWQSNFVGGFKAIGTALKALGAAIKALKDGDFAGMKSAALGFQTAVTQALSAVPVVNFAKSVAAGKAEFDAFEATLGTVSESAGFAAGDMKGLLSELDKLDDLGGEGGEGGGLSKLEAAREQLEALTIANAAFAQSLAQSSGQGLIASFQVDELTSAMYGLTSGALADLSEGLTEFETAQILKVVGAMTSLVGEAEAAVSPLSQVQQLLLDDDPVSVIADIAASYKRLARDSATGWLDGAEEDIENLQSMRELLAEMLITQDRLKIIGGEAFALEVDPFIESLKDAILEAEQELRSTRMEIQASVDEQSLTDIRSSISQGVADGIYLGASTMQSLAGGDVAGAAGGIASAAGASPMVGAVVAAIGAVAEIGQMTVKEIRQNTKSFVKNLDNGFKVIVKALPHVIQTLLEKLPGILIDALFTFGEFILSGELARVIAVGVWEGVKGLISAIKSILTSDVESAEDVRRSGTGFWTDIARLGLNERDNQKDRDRDGWSFASGNAKVAKTGMALIHRGESIIQAGGRAAQDQQHRMGGSGITVNISTAVMDRDVIPRLVREIDRVVGTYGRTTAAFAGG